MKPILEIGLNRLKTETKNKIKNKTGKKWKPVFSFKTETEKNWKPAYKIETDFFSSVSSPD